MKPEIIFSPTGKPFYKSSEIYEEINLSPGAAFEIEAQSGLPWGSGEATRRELLLYKIIASGKMPKPAKGWSK